MIGTVHGVDPVLANRLAPTSTVGQVLAAAAERLAGPRTARMIHASPASKAGTRAGDIGSAAPERFMKNSYLDALRLDLQARSRSTQSSAPHGLEPLSSSVGVREGPMSSARLVRSATITAVLALATVMPVGAQSSTDEIEAAIAFREAHGLRTDRDYVLRTLSESSDFPVLDWKFPISLDEDAELNRRVIIQGRLDEATAYAVKQDSFAGWFIDHRDGGAPVFLFTDAPRNHRAAIAERLPAGIAFRVERAEKTYDALVRQKYDLWERVPELANSGVDVVSIALDVKANRLLVGIRGSLADARDGLGEGVGLRHDEPGELDCTISNCDPHKAGLKITNSGDFCTVAYLAKQQNGNLVAITAGHCNQFAGGNTWYHNGTAIGSVGAETFPNSGVWGIADAGTIVQLTNYWDPDARNKIISTNESPMTSHRVTSVTIPINQAQGVNVCRTGAGWEAKTGYQRSCGDVYLLDQIRESCNPSGTICRDIDHQWEVDFDSTGGDSGGPVYSKPPTANDNVSAFGIHVHSENDNGSDPQGWYSPLYYVTQALANLGSPVNIDHYCITSNC